MKQKILLLLMAVVGNSLTCAALPQSTELEQWYKPDDVYAFQNTAKLMFEVDGIRYVANETTSQCYAYGDWSSETRRQIQSLAIPSKVCYDERTWDVISVGIPSAHEDVASNLDFLVEFSTDTLIVEEGIDEIGISNAAGGAFHGIRHVELPASIKSIGRNSFTECLFLRNLHLPCNLVEIGNLAFQSSGLPFVKLPGSIAKIGESAFHIGVKRVYAASPTPPELGKDVFPKGTVVYVPATLKGVYATAPGWQDYDIQNVRNADIHPEDCDSYDDYYGNSIRIPGVGLSQDSMSFKRGEAGRQLTVDFYPADVSDKYRVTKWSTTNSHVAVVTGSGFVTPLNTGECDIIASNDADPWSKACHITVESTTERLAIVPADLELDIEDDAVQLNAVIEPSDASQKLEWRTTDLAIARVSASGLVEPMGIGECHIIARTTDGSRLEALCHVTVTFESGISDAALPGAKVCADHGAIRIEGEGGATIYTPLGTPVATTAGSACVPVAPGVYVVRTRSAVTKVVIR